MSIPSNFQLFSDKYTPASFDDITFNHEASTKLRACSQAENIPHIVIKGSEGSGRKTFAILYLMSKFNLDYIHIKSQPIEIKNSSKTIELQMLHSDYHYQIDPSIHGVYDRIILQSFIKDILQSKPVNGSPYHIVIVNNADKLTVEAQQSLRRTLEKSTSNSRFIFIVNQESTLIEALVSRCVQIRLGAPTNEQIISVLENICKCERIQYIPEQLQQITDFSGRNLAKSMTLLQNIHLNSHKLLETKTVLNFEDINENDKYIAEMADMIMIAKTPQEIQKLRESASDLLVHCVDPVKIIKGLFYNLFIRMKNESKKHNLIEIMSKYENTLKQGSKPIYHIEGFIVSAILLRG